MSMRRAYAWSARVRPFDRLRANGGRDGQFRDDGSWVRYQATAPSTGSTSAMGGVASPGRGARARRTASAFSAPVARTATCAERG